MHPYISTVSITLLELIAYYGQEIPPILMPSNRLGLISNGVTTKSTPLFTRRSAKQSWTRAWDELKEHKDGLKGFPVIFRKLLY